MILCCKVCGKCFHSGETERNCDYCSGNTEILFTDEEVSVISRHELNKMINVSRERFKENNPDYNKVLWESREYKEEVEKNTQLQYEIKSHMLTTGYNFEGYTIKEYIGVISGETVLGTGFMSEVFASASDFLGEESTAFSDKMRKAKMSAMDKLIRQSVAIGGNGIIGVDFDYINFANNMIGVSVNGTAVVVEKDMD